MRFTAAAWRRIKVDRWVEMQSFSIYKDSRGYLTSEGTAFVKVDNEYYESTNPITLGQYMTLNDANVIGNPAPPVWDDLRQK